MATASARQPLSLKLRATTESVTEARHSIEEYARSLGMVHVGDVALAVSEAVGNAVAHAYRVHEPGTIELRAELLVPDTLLVAVIDDGDGMSPNPGSSGLGLGLPLMGSLPMGLEIERHDPHGTTVRMRFSLTG
jgi:anti-sigma regulatory factor (Ser/Thr protein kinase)